MKVHYRYVKKYEIRADCGLISGYEGYEVMTLEEEAVGEGVKCHGKRYLGAILFDGGLTSISAAVPLLTNATKIIKYSKAVHSTCAAT